MAASPHYQSDFLIIEMEVVIKINPNCQKFHLQQNKPLQNLNISVSIFRDLFSNTTIRFIWTLLTDNQTYHGGFFLQEPSLVRQWLLSLFRERDTKWCERAFIRILGVMSLFLCHEFQGNIILLFHKAFKGAAKLYQQKQAKMQSAF